MKYYLFNISDTDYLSNNIAILDFGILCLFLVIFLLTK